MKSLEKILLVVVVVFILGGILFWIIVDNDPKELAVLPDDVLFFVLEKRGQYSTTEENAPKRFYYSVVADHDSSIKAAIRVNIKDSDWDWAERLNVLNMIDKDVLRRDFELREDLFVLKKRIGPAWIMKKGRFLQNRNVH